MLRRGKTAAFAAVLVVAAACGRGEDAAGTTLEVWHYEAPTSAMGVAWQEAIKEFESSHPGVRVRFQEKGFEQIQKTAPMVLNSREAPDVLEYNKGNATTGLLSKQGLLTDLSDEAGKRGWDKLLGPGLQTTARYDEKGVMGSGKWFGVPNYAEYVTVYYNKDAFQKRGLAVPTTFAEFTAAMDAFATAGVTPLAVGGAEYPAQHILYQLALSKADRGWVDRFQRYTGPVDFQDAAWTYGAETFAEWVRKGYISGKAAGVKAEDMGAAFARGDHPIMISGSWWHGRLAKEITGFQWGTFLWPGNTFSAGSSGNHWVVPQGSKNKQLAYDFIDITMRKGIQSKLAEAGAIPVVADQAPVTDPKNKVLAENFSTLVRGDGLAFYPDWPAPGYYDVMVSAAQKLINRSAQPRQILDELAKPYRENLATVGR